MSKGSGSTRNSSSSAPRGLSTPQSNGGGISKANIQQLYNANYLENKTNPTDADREMIVNAIVDDYGKYITNGFDNFYDYHGKELSEAIISALVGKDVKIKRSKYSTEIQIDDKGFISMRNGRYGPMISYFVKDNIDSPRQPIYHEREFHTWKEMSEIFKKK